MDTYSIIIHSVLVSFNSQSHAGQDDPMAVRRKSIIKVKNNREKMKKKKKIKRFLWYSTLTTPSSHDSSLGQARWGKTTFLHYRKKYDFLIFENGGNLFLNISTCCQASQLLNFWDYMIDLSLILPYQSIKLELVVFLWQKRDF